MLPPSQQRGILFESVSQIELGAMPLPAYKRLHRESVVTPEQLMVLRVTSPLRRGRKQPQRERSMLQAHSMTNG